MVHLFLRSQTGSWSPSRFFTWELGLIASCVEGEARSRSQTLLKSSLNIYAPRRKGTNSLEKGNRRPEAGPISLILPSNFWCLWEMTSAIGWYGPLIDLSEAALHVGDFVQLLVFVHRSTPVQVSLSVCVFFIVIEFSSDFVINW